MKHDECLQVLSPARLNKYKDDWEQFENISDKKKKLSNFHCLALYPDPHLK